ncbi:hypothetical protein HDU67_001947, partial [Dinochytrium kinnereticum]
MSDLVATLGSLPCLETVSLAVTFSGAAGEVEGLEEAEEVATGMGGVEEWLERFRGVEGVVEREVLVGLGGRFVAGVVGG